MGFHPGLCCCALSALGFVFSSLEAYSQQSRSKKYAALAVPAAQKKCRMGFVKGQGFASD
jgi:hypothetical protein